MRLREAGGETRSPPLETAPMNSRKTQDPPPRPVEPVDEGVRELPIGEAEFRDLLRKPAGEFFSHFRVRQASDPSTWPKRVFSMLAQRAHVLETFLDDHDARYNRAYCFLAELVASIRGFSSIAAILGHIRVRLPRYRVRLPVAELEQLQRAMSEGNVLVCTALQRLLQETLAELARLGLELPETPASGVDGEESVRRYLPHDLEVEEGGSDEERVAAILSRYMEVSSRLQRAENLRPKDDPVSLTRFVANAYDETEARALETMVHNVQSAYDTHLKFTALEAQNPELRVFRGHISLGLHLLEIGTLLVHFYERHESEIQHRQAKERVAALIDGGQVLHHAVFFALYHASAVLLAARPMASELLASFVQQEEIELALIDGGILHARPLSLIVSVVRHHGTSVDMVIGEESTAANSIMGLIVFAGRHPDARSVRFRGDRRPLEDLRLLFEAGLGENGTDGFPEQLSYLLST